MTTILATIELGLRFGHIAHVAPVARGLKRRGIATAVAVRDVVTATEVADRPFAAILQAPCYQRPVPRVPTLTYAQVVADGGLGNADHATALVAAWLLLFDGLRPDALVSEFAPVSLLAAHIAGLRAVRCGQAWVAPPPMRPMPSLMPWLAHDEATLNAAGAVADAVVATVCRRFGAPPLDGLPELLANSPRLLGTWPELDHYGVTPHATYYGPMSGLAAAARPDWPDGDGPRVFVYMPAAHAAAVPLATALADLGWPSIWHGPGGCPVSPPPTIRVAPEPVDIAHVLAGAAIFAGRGGHGVGCDALRYGCAQLVAPDTLETALLGWRLERQHLGRQLPEMPDTAAVVAGLRSLVDDQRIAAATAAAKARYASYDPVRAEDILARDICAALDL